jgi:hypothetical protein
VDLPPCAVSAGRPHDLCGSATVCRQHWVSVCICHCVPSALGVLVIYVDLAPCAVGTGCPDVELELLLSQLATVGDIRVGRHESAQAKKRQCVSRQCGTARCPRREATPYAW